MYKYLFTILVFVFSTTIRTYAQGSPDYNGGYKIKFDDDGQKYLRLLAWSQFQTIYNPKPAPEKPSTSFKLRRSRFLLFGQINEKFLIVTHFGLNNLTAANMDPIGNRSNGPQLFMHDAWIQYNIAKKHSIGAGLHYFNGISRLSNQSTLNILGLGNNRQSWATLGLSDQFARHLGVFAKGSVGKFQYQVAVNDALINGLDMRDSTTTGEAVYGGARILGASASKNYAGYFTYSLFDLESNFLPFRVGSYLGTKKVFNIGAGFFYHPNGSVLYENAKPQGEDVMIFAGDVFLDMPLGSNNSSITAYAVYQNNNYGKDYYYSAYGTGNMIYAQLAYLIPGSKEKSRFQPYVSYANNSYTATSRGDKNISKAGVNMFLSGHNCKLTLEYLNSKIVDGGNSSSVTLQAMIYL